MALDPASQAIVARQNQAAAEAKQRRLAQPAQAGPVATGGSVAGGRVYAGDQRSYTDYTDPNALGRDLAVRDKYNKAAEDRMWARFGSASRGGGPGAGTVSRAGNAGEDAARAAAFARAKEQSGQIAQSSLAGLRNALARRGISGGGYANMRTAEALAPAADQLQDFTREQLIQDLGQARHVADLGYQGDITQRGQTLQAQQAERASLLGLLRSGGLY